MKLRLINRKKTILAYLIFALLAAAALSPCRVCGADFNQKLKAAESGAASAQYHLGFMYYNGQG